MEPVKGGGDLGSLPGRLLSRRRALAVIGIGGASVAAAASLAINRKMPQGTADEDESWWNPILVPAPDVPTITSARSSNISGGVYVTPTGSYTSDPKFRFDGCHSVELRSDGLTAPESPERVIPETVTDAKDIELIFRATRSGSDLVGVRAVVDGKLSHLKMLRFPSDKQVSYYYKFSFPTARVRHLRFEVDGQDRFQGAVIGAHSVFERPLGTPKRRHTAIGDSITAGRYSETYAADGIAYMRFECHSYYQSILMGCDSYINLGIPGTGWCREKRDDPFSARIATALAGSPQILGFYGSRNDADDGAQVRAAVVATLSRVQTVPTVLVCGPQQAGFSELNEIVKKGVVTAGRTWLNLDGVAPNPMSNPTRHPTFTQQLALARAAFEQTDMEAVDDADARRPAAPVLLQSSMSSPIAAGDSASLRASVDSDQVLSGNVQFFDREEPIGPPIALKNGQAQMDTGPLHSVAHSFTATFLPQPPEVGVFAESVPVPLDVV